MGATASIISSLPQAIDQAAAKRIMGDLYSPSNFAKLKSGANEIQRDVMVSFLSKAHDVFVSHDWGTDENGRDNHARVKSICRELQARGLKIWLDEEQMAGDTQQCMVDGIDSSQSF